MTNLKATSSWAKKKSSKPKTVNRRLLKAPTRFCKYCNRPIPKTQGLSTKTYSIKDFCCREHFMLAHRVIKTCPECGTEFLNYKSGNDTHCEKCAAKKAEDLKYKKKCSNPTCTNLIHFQTIIRFGKKRFCCLQCFADFMGENLRRCEKCNNPIVSLCSDLQVYLKHKNHMSCHRTTYFFKKMEEKSKQTYTNYKEFPLNDPGNTDSD
jgi:hypothetical protein